jgi:hypothetical protein
MVEEDMREERIETDATATSGIKASSMDIEMMMPSMQLRFSKTGQLQQLWTDIFSSKSEWRDIPTEE